MKKIEHVWVWLDEPNFGPIQKVGTLSRGDKGVLRWETGMTTFATTVS